MISKQKILIVDDDVNIAELISLYLTKECFDTLIVNDGEAAIREFSSYQPNLVLLDLMLPESMVMKYVEKYENLIRTDYHALCKGEILTKS